MSKFISKPVFIFAGLLFLFLSFPSFNLAQVELALVPSIFDLSLGRGGTKVFSFELINDNKEKTLSFTISTSDITADRDGTTVFLPVGTSNYSCSKWLAVEPQEVTVGPGQKKKIIAKLSVPGSASAGGYYSAIICELVNKNPQKTQTGQVIRWQLACLIKLSVTGGKLEKEAQIEDFKLRTLFETEEEKNKGLTFVAAVKNEGNIHITADGKLVVLTPERTRKGEVDFKVGTGTVLPGNTRDFVAIYDRLLPEGNYIARATFRYGGTSTLEKEIPFTIAAKKTQGQQGQESSSVVVSSLKAIPEVLKLKIPAGGFRIAGITLQNQTSDPVRIALSLDKAAGIQDWFSLEPETITIEGGREAKILVHCTIPTDIKPGLSQTKIIAVPVRLYADGKEEKLESQSIGISIEVPTL